MIAWDWFLLALGVLIGCVLGVAMMVNITDDLFKRVRKAEQAAADARARVRHLERRDDVVTIPGRRA